MESNRTLLFFIFGISLLPKIYSDIFPSLFIIKKPNNNYAVADEFQYIEGVKNDIKFSTSPEYQLYNACPEKNAPLYQTYALKPQESVTNFEARTLEEFVKGDFANYNCSNPIKAVVLKSNKKFEKKYFFEYHLGFLIHDINGTFDKLSEKYKNFTEIQEYEFLRFLTIRLSTEMVIALEANYQIVNGGLLEPDPAYSGPFPPNEKNINIYGFDVDLLYTEEHQRQIFSKVFPDIYSDYFSYPDRSLRKVQLVPHEDFLLETWKLASFMDLNTTAIWEQLYHQLRKIEIFVRKVARELNALTIETGAARNLTLLDSKGKRKGINLFRGRKSPVRKYAWKLIKLKQSDNDAKTQAILIVMHNDPYSTDQEPICDDVSENWGWMVSNNDYKTGLTYGCKVDENTTLELHDKFKMNYSDFNLNNVWKLKYDENREEIWVHEDIASKIRKRTYIFPSLFIIKKPDMFYTVADKFEYVEGQDKVLKFSTSPGYQLYNACPEENAPFHRTYALKVQELVTDFEVSPLQQFINGDFVKYNCPNPIKPIALKSKQKFNDPYTVQYDIGFLIYEKNGVFKKLSEKYENFPEITGYNFLHVLTITMHEKLGAILSALHRLFSGGLLEAEPAYSGPFKPNEKNDDVYGFDVNYLYTEDHQRKIFSSIFPEQYSHYFSYPNQSLRKVQLAPHEDFLLNTWKLSSLMDLNTTAMWEQVYPQWRTIEAFIRKVAQEQEALIIETGTSKILSLLDVKGKHKPVYLGEEQRHPVAECVWKLIMRKPLDNDDYTIAILIVMHNDPYTPDQEPICDDVSENWGWMVSNKDYKTGLTYGCPVKEEITRKLHDRFRVNYRSFKLSNGQKVGRREW